MTPLNVCVSTVTHNFSMKYFNRENKHMKYANQEMAIGFADLPIIF